MGLVTRNCSHKNNISRMCQTEESWTYYYLLFFFHVTKILELQTEQCTSLLQHNWQFIVQFVHVSLMMPDKHVWTIKFTQRHLPVKWQTNQNQATVQSFMMANVSLHQVVTCQSTHYRSIQYMHWSNTIKEVRNNSTRSLKRVKCTECWDGLKSSLNTLQAFVVVGEWHRQTYLSQQLHLHTKQPHHTDNHTARHTHTTAWQLIRTRPEHQYITNVMIKHLPRITTLCSVSQ